ncbi:ribonuclease D [Shewanella intestini]|uniref:Ribonuclease D n=1 Tax=Shewanella intestini TaxID=2017544 RepID=A0ABS5HZ91_9GAMM|nr:ribonuclease D [Shewanella sp. XMDDZSB0408]MBR9727091.1 ribonuclease D [Shewanella intestini]MRG35893.1 ribonuclease D [Shewanella sp. XMDDZSB0408]
MIPFDYIDNDSDLIKLVEQYQQAKLLVLDTEFVRTRTYYANLGLIQAYDGVTLALIDPVAIHDLSPFWQLLSNPQITKLLHSCSEDLEVFAHYGQCQPAPLFDSQIAASLCNMGHGLGYAKLVQACLDVEIDKGESRTDWMKRPLSDAQLNYAANDVSYLYNLYPQLVEKLQESKRLSWLLEEGERITEGRLSPANADEAYLKVKNAYQLLPKQLACLKVLAKWRLEKAVSRNLALGFVLKDHALIALAKKQPTNLAALNNLVDLTEHEKRYHGKEIVRLIEHVDYTQLPEPLDVIALKSGYKAAFKNVKTLLTGVSEEQQVPMEFIGSKRLIHEFMVWLFNNKQGQLPLLKTGWRAQVINGAIDGVHFNG